MTTLRPATSLLLVLVLAVAACSEDDREPAATSAAAVVEDDDPKGRAPAAAPASASDELVVEDVWSRMSSMRSGVAAVYLAVQNPTGTGDVLIGARVPADTAGRVEIHETYLVEGEAQGDHGGMPQGDGPHGRDEDDVGAPMMAMRQIDSIEVPAGGSATLEPGGLHLMLMELVDDLAPGDTYELTLEFERSAPVTVVVEVRAHG